MPKEHVSLISAKWKSLKLCNPDIVMKFEEEYYRRMDHLNSVELIFVSLVKTVVNTSPKDSCVEVIFVSLVKIVAITSQEENT